MITSRGAPSRRSARAGAGSGAIRMEDLEFVSVSSSTRTRCLTTVSQQHRETIWRWVTKIVEHLELRVGKERIGGVCTPCDQVFVQDEAVRKPVL